MTWALEYKGKRKSLAAWFLSGLKRSRWNQGPDTLSFTHHPESLDASPPFSAESTIRIFRNDTCWFHGIITRTPTLGNASSEKHLYQAQGPWWHLDNLVFQQQWIQSDHPNAQTIDVGRIVLGQNAQGARMTTGAQITEILDYAIQQGAPFQIGTIEPNVYAPYDETVDLSCAEAIQRMLKWTPDAIISWDYSTPLPTINIKRRHNIPAQSLAIDSLSKIELTPRHDLLSPAVLLKYEKTHTTSEGTYSTVDLDASPPTATGREFKSIVMTIDLEGSRSHSTSQEVTTAPLNLQDTDWWLNHVPALRDYLSGTLEIKNITRTSSLPRELIHGSIAPWMKCKVEEDVITAKVSYQTESTGIVDQTIAVKVYATNATTKRYEHHSRSQSAEGTPQGLAQALHESLSQLHYDGKIVLHHEELPPSLGTTLNITGGLKSWETMHALVQYVEEDLDRAITKIQVGPAKHLGPDDLVELLRLNRKRRSPQRQHFRVLSTHRKPQGLEQGTHNRIENATLGTGALSKWSIQDPKKENCAVRIGTERLNAHQTVELREEYCVEDGDLKKRMVLASQPYELGESHG